MRGGGGGGRQRDMEESGKTVEELVSCFNNINITNNFFVGLKFIFVVHLFGCEGVGFCLFVLEC